MSIDPSFRFVDQPACALCEGTLKAPLTQLDDLDCRFHWVVCRSCGMVSMDPAPDPASYTAFYARAFWELEAGALPATADGALAQAPKPDIHRNVRYQRQMRIPRVELVLAPVLAKGLDQQRVLEVGCSWGQTLAHLHREYGASVFGVEPSERARAFLADRHFEIDLVANTCEALDDRRDLDGTMDLVMFSHSLERITDQNHSLAIAHRLLRDDGILYIDTPNFLWKQVQGPYHPFLYTPDTLTAMVTKNGFVVDDVHTTPAPAGGHWGNVLTYWRHRDQHCAVRARKGPAPASTAVPAATEHAADPAALMARHNAGRRAADRVDNLRHLPRNVLGRAPILRALLTSVRR